MVALAALLTAADLLGTDSQMPVSAHDGSIVNTLPGAAPLPLFGKNGEDVVFSPVLIPANGSTATITINSNQERYFYMSSSGGAVLGLHGNDVTPGDRDTVTLDYEDMALSGYDLTPQRSTTELLPEIGVELGAQERLLFRFWQLDIEAAGTASFDVLDGQHGVTYGNGSTQPSEHFIIVDAVDGAAEQAGTRIFGPMTVAAGADQRIIVADWPASNSLKVETDADGDSIYETTEFFGGRSCGSNDVDGNGVPDACQSGPNLYMPIIAR